MRYKQHGYSKLSARLFALVAVLALALVSAATAGAQLSRTIPHRTDRTTTPVVYVIIHVTLSDSGVKLSRYSSPRGAEAKFVIRNVGTHVRGFQFGTSNPGPGQHGFQTDVKPRQKKTHFLFFDYPGKVPFFGSAPKKVAGKFEIGACPKAEVGTGVPGCGTKGGG